MSSYTRQREEEEDEEAELESVNGTDRNVQRESYDRLEIASLTRASALLQRQVASLTHSKSQLETQCSQEKKGKRQREQELDRQEEQDEQEEDGGQKRTRGSNNRSTGSQVHSFLRLQSDLAEVAQQFDQALANIAIASKQAEEILLKGRIVTQQDSKIVSTTDRFSSSSFDPTAHTQNDLPSLAVDALGAFEADEARRGTSYRTSTNVTHTTNSNNDQSSASSAVASPWLIHQTSLLQEYLQEDDLWAKSLNELFKALFGGGDGAHASVLNEDHSVSTAREELESVVRNTPHGGRFLSRMSSSSNTLTPAKGKIVSTTATSQKPARIQEEENEGEEKEGTSFHTPPQARSLTNGTSQHLQNEDQPSHGVASRSTLTPTQHAMFSAELTRLYTSFPTSQDYWLCHNLLFLAVKAKIQEQHQHMVKEEMYRAMSRIQINELLAEVGLQVAGQSRQLSILLSEAPEQSDGGGGSGTGGVVSLSTPATSFTHLWHRLRSLQLLEILRADLTFAHARQKEYLSAQHQLSGDLIQQRTRHEVLLGAWRMDLGRLERLQTLLASLSSDLQQANLARALRDSSYSHAEAIRTQTRHINDTSRLTIDGRAGFLKRLDQVLEGAKEEIGAILGTNTVTETQWKQMDLPSPAAAAGPSTHKSSAGATSFVLGSTPAPGTSFESLLASATFLSAFTGGRFEEMVLEAGGKDRSDQLQQLIDASKEARKGMFEDGLDLYLEPQTGTKSVASSTTGAKNLDRLNSSKFQLTQADAIRAVDTVADGLNKLTQQLNAQRLAIDSSGEDPQSMTIHATLADVATRSVWTEFIQAPDLLEQRVDMLKKQLQSYQ